MNFARKCMEILHSCRKMSNADTNFVKRTVRRWEQRGRMALPCFSLWELARIMVRMIISHQMRKGRFGNRCFRPLCVS